MPRISPACDRCYAAQLAKRARRRDPQRRDLWDPHAQRVRTSPSYWQPHRWHRAGLASGRRHRVFCASMADIFDNRVPAAWRGDLWALIRATQALDWLLLTTRPQTSPGCSRPIGAMAGPTSGSGPPPKIRQRRSAASWHFAAIPAKVRFLSCEPLLGSLDLAAWPAELHWVICDRESGGVARAMQPGWVRSLRDQAHSMGAAFCMKRSAATAPSGPASVTLRGRILLSGR